MKTIKNYLNKLALVIPFAVILFGIQGLAQEKGISVYQFRHVPQDQMEEFIERETKYWSVVAEKGMANGNLIFWGLFQKVGGFDMPNSANILFINTFKNIDDREGIWNPLKVFPNIPMAKMETFSMGTVMHTLFVKPETFVVANNTVPETDYKYVKINFHNASDPKKLIALENKYWAPFIQPSMDGGVSKQKAFGNGLILSPRDPKMKANTISYDIYATLSEALNPTWDDAVFFPEEGFKEIMDLEIDQRTEAVYKIVKLVTPK